MAFLRFYRAALAAACGTSNPNRIVVGKRASSTASSSLISNTIDSIDSVNWDDRIGLQSAWSNPEKGWQVDVEWKTTPYGAGLFAKQDMKTGTILRIGRTEKNLMQFKTAGEMKSFCEQGTGKAIPAVVSYVSDYFYGFDPNYNQIDEKNPSSGQLPVWYGIWVPGNGLNHGIEPNTVYRTAAQGISHGIDLVALTDIASGDELLDDYRRHGKPPAFALEFSQQFGIDMNFVGCNDFV